MILLFRLVNIIKDRVVQELFAIVHDEVQCRSTERLVGYVHCIEDLLPGVGVGVGWRLIMPEFFCTNILWQLFITLAIIHMANIAVQHDEHVALPV